MVRTPSYPTLTMKLYIPSLLFSFAILTIPWLSPPAFGDNATGSCNGCTKRYNAKDEETDDANNTNWAEVVDYGNGKLYVKTKYSRFSHTCGQGGNTPCHIRECTFKASIEAKVSSTVRLSQRDVLIIETSPVTNGTIQLTTSYRSVGSPAAATDAHCGYSTKRTGSIGGAIDWNLTFGCHKCLNN